MFLYKIRKSELFLDAHLPYEVFPTKAFLRLKKQNMLRHNSHTIKFTHLKCMLY